MALSPPRLLQALPGWLVWRYETASKDKPGTKPRKVPYYVSGFRRVGKQGSRADRSHLTTYGAALEAAAKLKMTGVGFALMPEFNIVALDFDNCVENEIITPQVLPLISSTYAEFSPSGKGIRAFYLGELKDKKSRANGSAEDAFGFEVFSAKGFVTFTGNALPAVELAGFEDTVAPLPATVTAYAERRFSHGKAKGTGRSSPTEALSGSGAATTANGPALSEAQILAVLARLDPDMAHDEWLKVGLGVHYDTQGHGFHLWDEWSSRGVQYPGSEELAKRWDSFSQREGVERPVTGRTLVHMAMGEGDALERLPGVNVAAPSEFDTVEGATVERSTVERATGDSTVKGEGAAPMRFLPIPNSEFLARQAPAWRIKHVLPMAALAVIYGESGSGKSFFALDMAMAIARGIEWRGQATVQGAVVYIAAEGAGGFRNRIDAYMQHHQVDPATVPLYVIPDAPNFLDRKDITDLVAALRTVKGIALIIVDTYAQVMPGNENSGEDAGKVIAHCRTLHQVTGATVVLIHHSGKDATKGARGWSGLRAATDAEYEVIRNGGDRMATVTKLKDADDGAQYGFKLATVRIGTDGDGDAITSCIVEHNATVPRRKGPVRKLGTNETLALSALQDAVEGKLTVDALATDTVKEMVPPGEGVKDRRRRDAERAIDSLLAKGLIVMVDGLLFINH